MIRLARATITFTLTVLISSFVFAQDSAPKIQAFGGFSWVRVDTGKLLDTTMDGNLDQHDGTFGIGNSAKGWDAEGQYNLTRRLGIAVDIGGRYGSPITTGNNSTASGLPNGTGYSFVAGPVYSFKTRYKMTPFVHAMFGWDRASLSASSFSGVSPPVSSLATTFTDAAAVLGGGLDYKISSRFSFRLAQLDDLWTGHNMNKFYNSAFDTGLFHGLATHQNNFRVSTGAVVRF